MLRTDDTSSITAPTNLVLILACAIDVITFFFFALHSRFLPKKKKKKKTFSPPYNRPSASHAKNRGGEEATGFGKTHYCTQTKKKEREKKRGEGGQNIQPTKLKEEGTGQERRGGG